MKDAPIFTLGIVCARCGGWLEVGGDAPDDDEIARRAPGLARIGKAIRRVNVREELWTGRLGACTNLGDGCAPLAKPTKDEIAAAIQWAKDVARDEHADEDEQAAARVVLALTDALSSQGEGGKGGR